MYSIKAIASLTGLSAETLRAWERRYACINPQRGTNGRRSYSQQDLEKLKLLMCLTQNGHAISKIAHLTCEQLRQFQHQASELNDPKQSHLFNQIIDAVQGYKIERCEQLLKKALLIYEPLDYTKEVLLPTLQRIGQLWCDGKINVAQEHLFSNCIKRIVFSMVNNLHQASNRNPSMLFATPSGEQHEFGILLACLIAATQQYTCYYLGADLPGSDIIDACRHLKPDIVVIGMVRSPPETLTITQVNQVIAYLDASTTTKLWLGGEGSKSYVESHLPPAIRYDYISDIEHFYCMTQR